MKKVFILILFISSLGFSQNKDPYALLKIVKDKFERVKDYQVEAKIKVDLEFLQVPDMTTKIFFKQPNKIKLDSKDFAMLPKQAFNFSPLSYLEGKYSAIYSGTEGKNTIIKILPGVDSVDFLLATLWIDTEQNVITKMEAAGKRGGTTRVEMTYPSSMRYPLPSKINFYIEIPGGLRIPSDPREKRAQSDNKKDTGKTQGGHITITYSNYQVNKGIPDKVFK